MRNGRPILNPEANYAKTGKGFYLVGSPVACVESDVLQSANRTGVPADQLRQLSHTLRSSAPRWATSCWASISETSRRRPRRPLEGPRSYLCGLGSGEQKEAWKQTEGTARAGTMTTAGNLVFQGTAQHQIQRLPRRYREKLWTTDTQARSLEAVRATRSMASSTLRWWRPAGGFGGGSYWAPNYARLLVYKLGGNVQLPEQSGLRTPAAESARRISATPRSTELGDKQYTAHCAGCHGNNRPAAAP